MWTNKFLSQLKGHSALLVLHKDQISAPLPIPSCKSGTGWAWWPRRRVTFSPRRDNGISVTLSTKCRSQDACAAVDAAAALCET